MFMRTRGQAKNRKLRQRRPFRLPSFAILCSQVAWALGRAARPALVLGGLGLGALFVVAFATWLRTSPRFVVQGLVLHGNARVTREEILALADLSPQANVFTTSLGAIRERVAKNPWIDRVEVTRRLPDRIAIAVTERQPSAVVVLGGAYLVDRAGRPFKKAEIDKGEAASLVAVTGLDRQRFAADPTWGASAVERALALVQAWQSGSDRPALGEVHLRSGGYTLYTLEGAMAVRVGAEGADVGARFQRFDVIWAALSPAERAQARTIHLDSRARTDRVTVGFTESL
jgi:cell division septal protein FtsQ